MYLLVRDRPLFLPGDSELREEALEVIKMVGTLFNPVVGVFKLHRPFGARLLWSSSGGCASSFPEHRWSNQYLDLGSRQRLAS